MRKIQFVKTLGRREGQGAGPEYQLGEVHTFEGQIAEGYAQAYIDRGYAVDYVEPAAPVAAVGLSEVASEKPEGWDEVAVENSAALAQSNRQDRSGKRR